MVSQPPSFDQPDHSAAPSISTRAIGFDLVARSVTHELRQSLSLIIGYTELLASDDLTADDRTALLLETRRAARRLAASLERLEQSDALPLRSLGPAGEH